jgi:hypothetical protein
MKGSQTRTNTFLTQASRHTSWVSVWAKLVCLYNLDRSMQLEVPHHLLYVTSSQLYLEMNSSTFWQASDSLRLSTCSICRKNRKLPGGAGQSR